MQKIQTQRKMPNGPKCKIKKKMFAYFPSPVYFPSPICTGQGLSGVPYRTRPGARQPVSPVLGQGYIKSNRGRAFFFWPIEIFSRSGLFCITLPFWSLRSLFCLPPTPERAGAPKEFFFAIGDFTAKYLALNRPTIFLWPLSDFSPFRLFGNSTCIYWEVCTCRCYGQRVVCQPFLLLVGSAIVTAIANTHNVCDSFFLGILFFFRDFSVLLNIFSLF